MEPQPNSPQQLPRPDTLIAGKRYIWHQKPTLTEVRFVAYHACPAFAIIQESSGHYRRCARHELREAR